MNEFINQLSTNSLIHYSGIFDAATYIAVVASSILFSGTFSRSVRILSRVSVVFRESCSIFCPLPYEYIYCSENASDSGGSFKEMCLMINMIYCYFRSSLFIAVVYFLCYCFIIVVSYIIIVYEYFNKLMFPFFLVVLTVVDLILWGIINSFATVNT